MCIILPTPFLYEDKMLWWWVSFMTDGVKVMASERSFHCMTTVHQFCSVPLFQAQVCVKKGTKSSLWRRMMTVVFWSEADVKSSASLNTGLSSWMDQSAMKPWSPCLYLEECWFWSLQPKRVLWKCKYDKRIIQPGPESSQDTSRTCRHRELRCFSGEQAGILPSRLACDDDGLT